MATLTWTLAQAQTDGAQVQGPQIAPETGFAHNFLRIFVGQQVMIRWTGTDLTLGGWAEVVDKMEVSNDGSAFSFCPVTTGGFNNSAFLCASGLSEGTHVTILRRIVGGTHFYYSTGVTPGDVFATITGASPQILPGVGDNSGLPVMADVSGVQRESQKVSAITLGTAGYAVCSLPEEGFRFNGAGSKLQIFVVGNGGQWAAYRDLEEEPLGVVTAPTDLLGGWLTVAEGLSGSHTFEVLNVLTGSTGNFNVAQIRMVDGSVDVQNPPPIRKKLIGSGSSSVLAQAVTNATAGFVLRIARQRNLCAINKGSNGRTLHVGNFSPEVIGGLVVAADITSNLPLGFGDFVIYGFGSNDYVSNTTTPEIFEQDYSQMLIQTQAAAPGVEILCNSITQRGVEGFVPEAFEAAIENAAAANNCGLADFGTTIPSWDNIDDGIHPNYDGYTQMIAVQDLFFDQFDFGSISCVTLAVGTLTVG